MELVERLLTEVESLEPRGLSMTAYSAAKLLFGDHRWTAVDVTGQGFSHADHVDKESLGFFERVFVETIWISLLKHMLPHVDTVYHHTSSVI